MTPGHDLAQRPRGKGGAGQAATHRARRWVLCTDCPHSCSFSWPVAELTAGPKAPPFKQPPRVSSRCALSRAATRTELSAGASHNDAPRPARPHLCRDVSARDRRLSLCHCGLDPQSVLARQCGSRIKSGMTTVLLEARDHVGSRQAVPGGGDLWGGCDARSGVGARFSALRKLARRGCLSGESFKRTQRVPRRRPQAEQRSGVGAKRRPQQREPSPGTACRDAKTHLLGRFLAAHSSKERWPVSHHPPSAVPYRHHGRMFAIALRRDS
jgi:hypothetical protein